MGTARLILASFLAVYALLPAAFAQQDATGMITRIDRINGTIAIQQQPEKGTVGSTGGASQEFNVKDSQLLEKFHAGDMVTFSATDAGSARTITKMDRQ